MSKLPFFPFYPLDWLRDTRKLSLEAKGVWIDILSLAWNEPRRGLYKRALMGFQNEHQVDAEKAKRILRELTQVALRVTLRNEKVTVISKRMMQFDINRINNAKRQERLREKRKSNAQVTRQTLDVRSQTLEVINNKDKKTAGIRGALKPIFSKPTPGEVTAYAKSIGFDLNGDVFVAHYESNGWKVGPNPMKNWRAAVVTWKHKEFRSEGTNGTHVSAGIPGLDPEKIRAAGHFRHDSGLRKVAAAGQILDGIRSLRVPEADRREESAKPG